MQRISWVAWVPSKPTFFMCALELQWPLYLALFAKPWLQASHMYEDLFGFGLGMTVVTTSPSVCFHPKKSC